MTIISFFRYNYSNKKGNECASVVGHFDGHDDAPVRCRAHRPMKHVQGYLRSHRTPPLGKYSPHISLADAMVIDFGVKIELWRYETAVPKLAFKRHNMDPLLSSSKQQAAWKGRTPQWSKPKSTAMFLAIKLKQRTKIVEVANHQKSLLKSLRSWAR